jgi:hypothetical protein
MNKRPNTAFTNWVPSVSGYGFSASVTSDLHSIGLAYHFGIEGDTDDVESCRLLECLHRVAV